MTFMEWCKQTARECDYNIPDELVKDVIVIAIRVALEEFLANPADANLDISSIGRFYLNHRVCHNNFPTAEHKEYEVKWTAHFKPALHLKSLLNGKEDIQHFTIAGAIPLYPEFFYNEDGSRKRGRGKPRSLVMKYDKKFTLKYSSGYQKAKSDALKLKKLEEQKGKLPDKDE